MPEVIIIGAGVVGTSIAYHLAKQSCRDVLVLEKNYIGSGSTGKCAGGIRQQFSAEINIRLSMESVSFFANFEEETGADAGFRQHGYLILATSEEELEAFRGNVERQRQLGLEVELISAKEAGELVPGLNVGDVLGATFCPTDGYADPYSVVSAFAACARRLGVRISEETEVTGIELVRDRLKRVVTTKGKFEAPVLVNAAGAHAGVIGRMVGLEIPIRPSRRHLFVTEPMSFPRRNLPMVVDFHNGFWFRPEGSCLIFGMRSPLEPEGFSTSVDWGFFADILAPAASQRLPRLKETGIMRGQAGLHADTPDCLAILGEAPGVAGFYLACGFSGHGFMHSPAVGRLMAELIVTGKSSLPQADALSLDRFQRKTQTAESAYI